MKNWKHITFDQRKVITHCLGHGYKVKEIAFLLKKDPTSISKEVKRNRYIDKYGASNDECPRLKRWPYVCQGCKKRYTNCIYHKFKYDGKIAQRISNDNLINSRRGIDIESEDFSKIDNLIKSGVDNGKSIYQIKIENSNIINKSISTLYRYVNRGYFKTKRHELPYAVTYKKRKKNKKYEYTNNKIDRSNHTYLDYLSNKHKHPESFIWQLDFLGTIKTDSKAIISLVLPELHFTYIDIITKPDSEKVVKFFDELEIKLTTENYLNIFQVILTDRDPCFNDMDGIEFSKITGEQRSKLFYCDPYVSNQKPNVENMNKQLRKFFPKGKSIDKYTHSELKEINKIINSTPVRSLDSNTPKDAFIKIFGEDIYNKLF